ncbi:ATP-binding protein [Bifidobacterium callitrichidarum]|uniref:ATPase n=1 Tax=Bifidobacterium callitrichidarum TaxID=2052941 RepID=A0A2U2MYH8_9BIFI|nr:ATP-binding protein [Bifidobacterium callitrichidarum]PWG61868.1 ATPase [Bifidobacterium callitrichidarum]
MVGFVGREHELETLRDLYARDRFDMVVVYGRRRVGKTSLIDEFTRDRKTLYFTALQQSSLLNLRGFSDAAYRFFGMPEGMPAFSSWQAAFSFVAEQARRNPREPWVLVFDEFPYAAMSEPSLPSVLQIAIDHGFKDTCATMILSGSNEGFMESRVLGSKSPLYGRRTAQIHLQPFDYLDAARFLPAASPEDLVRYYATFGGTPYYLALLDSSATYEDNVRALMYDKLGLLYEEPMMLLRQELREPGQYYSVLQAIASGSATPKSIAEHAGVETNAVGGYLRTLEGLNLVRKQVPFGDDPAKSRKGMYLVDDPFFAYWFRFVGRNTDAIERSTETGRAVADRVTASPAFATYLGQRFESVCLQWLTRANGRGLLPFLATRFGKWWGTDPRAREQTDIDVIAADPETRSILLGECKWRNTLNETQTLDALRARTGLVRGYTDHRYALFTKKPVSQATQDKCKAAGTLLMDAENLYSR